MADLTIIAAVSDNDVIGINNKIPWRIPEDMNHFRDLTNGHPVIMGRKTYESLGKKGSKFRPLPNRKNIVLSKSFETDEAIYVARNIDDVFGYAKDKDSFVIGGSEIYNLFFPYCSRMEITRVHRNFSGDSFFPNVDWGEWELVREESHCNEKLFYSFQSYIKRFNGVRA